MTIRQAAERLEISVSLTYKLIEEKRLGCLRIGQEGRRGKIIVRESDITAFLAVCEQKAN